MLNNWLSGKIFSPGIAIIFVVASILLELLCMKHQCFIYVQFTYRILYFQHSYGEDGVYVWR